MAKKKLAHDFDDISYARINGSGDDSFHEHYENKEDCVDAGEDKEAGELVATYKLVKVERLKLVRSAKLVKA
jgi:hypothetical protein